MSEKEQFLSQLEKELSTTMRVLKAYPAAKSDLKPHAKCKAAKELAWMFVTEQKASEQALDGGIEFGKMPKAPGTLGEVISTYEQSSKAFVERIKQTPEAELNTTVKFFVAPKQMGDIRKMDLLWFMLMDSVHHRGQFSRSEEHTSELQSPCNLVCRLLLEKKKKTRNRNGSEYRYQSR